MDCSPPGSSVHGILQTQGSDPHLLCLLHWQGGSLSLAPPGKPKLEGLFSTGSRKRETVGVKHMPMNFTTELNLKFILLTHIYSVPFRHCGLPRWLSSKEYACQCKRPKFDPGSERSPGEGNGNPLQYSCLGNSMDRGAWQATVHGVAKESDTT